MGRKAKLRHMRLSIQSNRPTTPTTPAERLWDQKGPYWSQGPSDLWLNLWRSEPIVRDQWAIAYAKDPEIFAFANLDLPDEGTKVRALSINDWLKLGSVLRLKEQELQLALSLWSRRVADPKPLDNLGLAPPALVAWHTGGRNSKFVSALYFETQV